MFRIDSQLEMSIYDQLACREVKSFRRALGFRKSRKVHREARLVAKRTIKHIRRGK